MCAFLRRDVQSVWQQHELKDRLNTYQEIFKGNKLPRYKLARLFYVSFQNDSNLEELLEIHEQTHPKFKEWINQKQSYTIQNLEEEVSIEHSLDEIQKLNFLRLKWVIFDKMIESCTFCENKCDVNRKSSQLGKCKIDDKAYVTSSFIHMGEEAPVSPSGTIFFYGCTMRCSFCQNWDISQEYDFNIIKGKRVRSTELASMYYTLLKQGARNINFVGGDPTPNMHIIIESFLHAQVNLPMLWNSNMFLSENSMKLISDIFDIWLPDIKYSNNECAKKYSKVSNYWDAISRNMSFIEQRGSGEYIIRHLVMPEHTKCCSIPILDWINENLKTPLTNIMGQYHPDYRILRGENPEINRRPSTLEMFDVRKHADDLGLYWKSVS